ncbi:adenine deaminase [Psychrobacillus sp. INOP01]|uniref:adenine deaminase n=1 Tax=Psychrobacillus sp. INOP01 TaxID=2829187 RepID=UPI001BA53AA2|nr:adenine deaminase [Psychrobacillus sp. INOP01]QUG43289.1 adenine deaminase [Psychrobacillus sp. INOP01]
MTIEKEQLEKRILVSQQKQSADFILRNATVADVFSLRWVKADIVVSDGMIVAIDATGNYEAVLEEDAEGKYVIPGLIDGHIHIESSMVTPAEFSRILLPHGITTVITDPHEIANVAGSEGIQFMLDDASNSEMDIHVMLPSSVPATPMEHAGAILQASDLHPFLENDAVLGLAEVMDFPAVLFAESNMMDKLKMAMDAKVIIDGHGSGLNSEQIRGYRAAGIQTDHECVTSDEALDRVSQGMYVLMREGSAAKNVRDLLPAVNTHNARRFLFCTDDKHLDELLEEGSINHAIHLAIKEGMEPLQAIQLATLNAAECYQLTDRGALAPGFIADFLLVESLEDLKAIAVWKNGVKVAQHQEMLMKVYDRQEPSTDLTNTVKLPNLSTDSFAIPFTNDGTANVMEVMPNQITTKKKVMKVPMVNGLFTTSVKQDLLKLAVIERHHSLGTIGLGIVHGFGLKQGAIATTIAHDSHNLIVLGTNDEDMLIASQELERIQGGFVIVHEGKILASLALPIAGLMTDLPAKETALELKKLHEALHILHPDLDFHLFLTLSFVSLPVIPELKLTDSGLFDVVEFKHIPIQVD